MDRRRFVETAVLSSAYTLGRRAGVAEPLLAQVTDPKSIVIRPETVAAPLPHFWEECVGSDRAAVAMRAQWQVDLERVKKETGMKSVRFHGLFNDEMGVWPSAGKAPNFLYVDTVFDALVERGLKPLVELGYMPGALASGTRTAFFYRGNVTPPKEPAQWIELIRALAAHCIERYGLHEVSSWSFEVWNEPNLPFFWAGTQADYFDLYKGAATALKAVNPGLKVGGPATAEIGWISDFLAYCAAQNVPVDFVSTHVYPDDPQKIVFGPDVHHPFEEVIPQALLKVRAQIKASKFPTLPLYLTEWSSQNPAFIAQTVKSCIGLVDVMSYWTFDNVFEELGIPKTFMNSSFGLIGLRGIPRPSFHTFGLLHKLGETQIATSDGPVLATRRSDGSLAILIWNLIPQAPGVRSSMGDPTVQTGAPESVGGATREITLKFEGSHTSARGELTRVDGNSGNLSKAYQSLGSPAYPTALQIGQLKKMSAVSPSENVILSARGEAKVTLPPNGVALLELPAGHHRPQR